jgi:hypothetical protein
VKQSTGNRVVSFRIRTLKSALPVALAAALCLWLTAAAPAQTDRFGPLTALSEGFLDPWQLTLGPDGYRMQNSTDTTSIRYVWETSREETLGTRTLTASVVLNRIEPSTSAGLLYGFEEEDDGTLFYYMFLVEGDHYVTLYRRDSDGVVVVSSVQTDAVIQGINELTIAEDGDQASFLVNGELVARLGGVRGIGTGRVGIVAWGTGDYLFTGFRDESPVPPRPGGKGPEAGGGQPPPAPAPKA